MDDKLDSILAALEKLELSQHVLREEFGRLRGHVSAKIDQVRTDLRADIIAIRTDLQADIIAIRTDLQADILAIRTDLQADILAIRTDLQADIITTRTDLRADIIATRTQIMDRLDRQQTKLDSMFRDIAVNWHSSERVERKVEADRDEIRSLAKMVSELTRMVRAMESRLSIVEEKP